MWLFKKISIVLALIFGSQLVNAEQKLVALTFDDGPNTETTPKVLDVLKKENVKATFFLIGDYINDESAGVMKRAVKQGCELANHSRTHRYMTKLADDTICAEIAYTNARIKETVGKAPKFFRPPYIDYNSDMHKMIDLTFICGIGAEDWLPEVSAVERASRIVSQVKDGDIILLHDFKGNDQTVDAIALIIPKLKKEGYKFVTVSELFKKKKIKTVLHNGIIYTNVYQNK